HGRILREEVAALGLEGLGVGLERVEHRARQAAMDACEIRRMGAKDASAARRGREAGGCSPAVRTRIPAAWACRAHRFGERIKAVKRRGALGDGEDLRDGPDR